MGMVSTLFIYIGKIAKDTDILNKRIPLIFYIIMIMLCIYCVKYCQCVLMVSNIYPNGFIDVINAVCISFIFLKICMLIDKYTRFLKRLFVFIGKNSLNILCIHLFGLNCLKWNTAKRLLLKVGLRNNTIICSIVNIVWAVGISLIVYVINMLIKKIKVRIKSNL